MIFIDENYQRINIGNQTLVHVRKILEEKGNYEDIFLETPPEEPAVIFYLKNGFHLSYFTKYMFQSGGYILTAKIKDLGKNPSQPIKTRYNCPDCDSQVEINPNLVSKQLWCERCYKLHCIECMVEEREYIKIGNSRINVYCYSCSISKCGCCGKNLFNYYYRCHQCGKYICFKCKKLKDRDYFCKTCYSKNKIEYDPLLFDKKKK